MAEEHSRGRRARGAEENLRRREKELETLNGRLRRYADDLARRVSEPARANRLLQERKEENKMFVYGVSHDLRSPRGITAGFGVAVYRKGNTPEARIQRATNAL